MDQQTLKAYNRNADPWSAVYRRAVPTELYHLLQQHFHLGHPTADIGCGSGRDVAWLVAHGYPTTGYDGSAAMRAESRRAYPGLDIREAQLPNLEEIADQAYANVLCAAVLMHLPQHEIATALVHLARIVRRGGRVLLSYRASGDMQEREADGRLFTPLAADTLHTMVEAAGLRVLESILQPDATREGVAWLTLAGEREG